MHVAPFNVFLPEEITRWYRKRTSMAQAALLRCVQSTHSRWPIRSSNFMDWHPLLASTSEDTQNTHMNENTFFFLSHDFSWAWLSMPAISHFQSGGGRIRSSRASLAIEWGMSDSENKTRAVKMAQQANVLAFKPEILVWSLGPTWWKTRTNPYKLPTDTHMCTVLGHPHVAVTFSR